MRHGARGPASLRGWVGLGLLLGIASPARASSPGAPLSEAERRWLREHQGRIVVAVERAYPPFLFLSEEGRPAGLAEEFLTLVESRLSVRFQRRIFDTLDEVLGAARRGEVHLVNAVTRTPSRETYLTFGPPFVSIPNVLVVRGEPGPRRDLSAFAGQRVSLVRSYAVTESLLARAPAFEPALVADDLAALLDVTFGRSRAAVVDLATAAHLSREKGLSGLRVAGEVQPGIQLAFGAARTEPMLASVLAKGLAAVSEDERRLLRERWLSPLGPPAEGRLILPLGAALLGAVLLCLVAVALWNRALKAKVTERTGELARLNESLREQRSLLQTVIDSSPAAVFAHDRDGKCLLVSRHAEEIVGRPLEDVLGRTFEELAPRRLAAALQAHHQEVLEQGLPTSRIEQLPLPGGARSYLALRVPLRAPTGEIYAVCGVATDITEAQRAEEERSALLASEQAARRRAEREEERALALADDVRVLCMRLAEVEDAERRNLARDLHDSIGQLLPLIRRQVERLAADSSGPPVAGVAGTDGVLGLLSEAIAQVRSLTFELYPTLLDDLGLVPALEWQAEKMGAQGVAVTVSQAGSTPVLGLGLSRFLFRAVRELLLNAHKHGRMRTAVVSVRWSDGLVRIQVGDDGVGFDVAALARPGVPHGLGLFDIRQRAEFLGGSLSIDSAPGEGTEIYLEVPVPGAASTTAGSAGVGSTAARSAERVGGVPC